MFVTIAVAVAVAIVTGFLSTNNHSSCGSTDIASSMDEDAAAADKSESKSTPSVSDRQGNDACNSEEDEDKDKAAFDVATTAVVCKKVGTSKIVVSIPEKDTETWSCNLNRHTQELRIKNNLKPL